jgi:hypothetical protein
MFLRAMFKSSYQSTTLQLKNGKGIPFKDRHYQSRDHDEIVELMSIISNGGPLWVVWTEFEGKIEDYTYNEAFELAKAIGVKVGKVREFNKEELIGFIKAKGGDRFLEKVPLTTIPKPIVVPPDEPVLDDPVQETSDPKPLTEMSRDELLVMARDLGLKPHWNLQTAGLIKLIEDAKVNEGK